MSSYNRVTPRATVGLLRWAATQGWGAAWRGTLPVAGVDGTLSGRFKGTPLEGQLVADPVAQRQQRAGGVHDRSMGRTLTFAIYANDMPGDTSARPAMDAALLAVAAAN
ncbi:D-alanyl-D-alanine carboxypeptidase [Sphingomonas sp. MMS24-JH45]